MLPLVWICAMQPCRIGPASGPFTHSQSNTPYRSMYTSRATLYPCEQDAATIMAHWQVRPDTLPVPAQAN